MNSLIETMNDAHSYDRNRGSAHLPPAFPPVPRPFLDTATCSADDLLSAPVLAGSLRKLNNRGDGTAVSSRKGGTSSSLRTRTLFRCDKETGTKKGVVESGAPTCSPTQAQKGQDEEMVGGRESLAPYSLFPIGGL